MVWQCFPAIQARDPQRKMDGTISADTYPLTICPAVSTSLKPHFPRICCGAREQQKISRTCTDFSTSAIWGSQFLERISREFNHEIEARNPSGRRKCDVRGSSWYVPGLSRDLALHVCLNFNTHDLPWAFVVWTDRNRLPPHPWRYF